MKVGHPHRFGNFYIIKAPDFKEFSSHVVRQTDPLKKRKDQNKGFFFGWGWDQLGLYERVIINRKNCSVDIDRMDINWWISEPFLGQRDSFYLEDSEKAEILAGTKPSKMTFVRHNFWMFKLYKLNTVFMSNFSASSYKSAFKG